MTALMIVLGILAAVVALVVFDDWLLDRQAARSPLAFVQLPLTALNLHKELRNEPVSRWIIRRRIWNSHGAHERTVTRNGLPLIFTSKRAALRVSRRLNRQVSTTACHYAWVVQQ